MRYQRKPDPGIPHPRPLLLLAVLDFVHAAREIPGVLRIALIGSLTSTKPVPKDADVLVWIGNDIDIPLLARHGRRLKGATQTINLGADIFLADENGRYIGRICSYRECHPRVACLARHCGRHIKDDLQVVKLSRDPIAAPPVELWPRIVRRTRLPTDVEKILLAELGNTMDTNGIS
ncbi:MAG: hypothetical protein ACREC6_09970 [Hyphomicrobiaceae bacterium]